MLIDEIVAGYARDPFAQLGRERLDDFAWYARDQVVRGHDHPFADHATGSDEAALADHGSIEYAAAHAEQRAVLDHTGMGESTVTEADPIAEDAGPRLADMQTAEVLHVALGPKLDVIDIAAQHGAEPHRATGTEADIADQGRIGSEEGGTLGIDAVDGDDGGHGGQGSCQSPVASCQCPASTCGPRQRLRVCRAQARRVGSPRDLATGN